METVEEIRDFVRGSLHARLEANEPALAFTARQWRTVDIARIAKSCGYDALYLDMEHSTMSLDDASQICTTALEVGITPIARVPSPAPDVIARTLDAGVMGLIVPHVNSAEAAQAVVRAAKYPPLGTRSITYGMPQLGGSALRTRSLQAVMNKETFLIAMIESAEGLANADAIAAVDGIDILFIGTQDLIADMDLTGDVDDPAVHDAYQRVIQACRRHGKHAGIGGLAARPDLMSTYVTMGARFVSVGQDVTFMMREARNTSKRLREVLKT